MPLGPNAKRDAEEQVTGDPLLDPSTALWTLALFVRSNSTFSLIW